MTTMLINLLAFIFVHGVLIVLHEAGHFLVARALGAPVEVFAYADMEALNVVVKGRWLENGGSICHTFIPRHCHGNCTADHLQRRQEH